jgi:hypothetical protein
MKAQHTALITAAWLALFSSTAMAQAGPSGMHTPDGATTPRMEKMREHMRERRTERHAQHLAQLKARLQLGAEQKAAWASFAEAMKPPAHPPVRPDRVAMEKLSTPERIEQMQVLRAQRDAEMGQRAQAIKAFYVGLTADQKKTFDAETARFMSGPEGQRMHGTARF